MLWTHAGWAAQATTALRISELRAHIAEVSERIAPTLGADGKSRDTTVLVDYQRMLFDQLKAMESLPDASSAAVNGGWGVSRFVTPG